MLAFRNYNPSLETRKRKPEPDVLINRLENKEKRSEKKGAYRRSKCKKNKVLERCQGNCGNKVKSSDNGDYLLVKSHGPSSYSVKGESRTKYGPPYIHFKNDCSKEYAHLKHDVKYEKFPLSIITIDKLTSELLGEEDKNNLIEYGLSFP